MQWLSILFRFFVDAVRPPFCTTHWIVLLYVILSAIYNPNSYFNHWTLPDTDDYTRFVQVFNWLDGQRWYDMRLPHLYPQHVISMHWARLVDIPLAGLLIAFEYICHVFNWTAPRSGLAMIVAFIMPCILLFLLLKLVRACARPLLGKRWAGVACLMVPLALQLVFQFSPMRVDHHAYILLGAGLSFYALQNMALGITPQRMAMLAGIAIGLAMWNSAEILPMLLGLGICMTLLMLFMKRPTFAQGALFGLSLLITCVLVLLMAKAPAERWVIEYDAFSLFHVMIAVYTLAFFVVMWAGSRVTKNLCILVALALFASIGDLYLFLQQFPDFIAGPYAKVNPLLHQVFFPNIREAVPFFQSWVNLGNHFTETPKQVIGGAIYYMLSRLFAPTLAIITCIYQLSKKHACVRMRRLWVLYAFFTIFYTALAMFWEVRVISYAQLFAIAPVIWLMLNYLKTLPNHYGGRQLLGWEIMVVLSFTVLPTIIIPGILLGSKLHPDILFYLSNNSELPCKDRSKVISHLKELHDDDHETATILTQMDYTPEFMFYTPHHFIAAPYHRNDRGISDMVMFFRSIHDDDAARTIAKKLDLDYILVCKAATYQGTLYRDNEAKSFVVNVNGGEVNNRPTEKDIDKGSLAFRLAYDKTPLWLDPVIIMMEKDFALYKVQKNLLDKPSSYAKPAVH